VADPSPFPFPDLLLNGDLPSSLPVCWLEITSGHLMLRMLRRHLLLKGLHLVGVCLCGAPCLGVVKQDRLHIGVEDPDLVVLG
jgi:hypothetical protein